LGKSKICQASIHQPIIYKKRWSKLITNNKAHLTQFNPLKKERGFLVCSKLLPRKNSLKGNNNPGAKRKITRENNKELIK